MMAIIRALVATTILVAGLIATAHAVPVTMNFTASGFTPVGPTDPVTGTIVWEGRSRTSDIESITSVTLTIAGHIYTLGEVGFVNTQPTYRLIGGTLNDVETALAGTNDFTIEWRKDTLTPTQFSYTHTGSASEIPGTFTFDAFSITAPGTGAPVLGPWGLLILAAALGLLPVVMRRRLPLRV